MRVTNQSKILGRKIKQMDAQYDLGKKAAEIFALPSGNLDKHWYLDSEDLSYKPIKVNQGQLDYSPLTKCFNKGLNEKDKKEERLNRLKNIKGKTDIKSQNDLFDEDLTSKAIAFIKKTKVIEDNVDWGKLFLVDGNKKRLEF